MLYLSLAAILVVSSRAYDTYQEDDYRQEYDQADEANELVDQYVEQGDYLNQYEDDTVEKPVGNEYYADEYVEQDEYLNKYEDDTVEKPGVNEFIDDEYVEGAYIQPEYAYEANAYDANQDYAQDEYVDQYAYADDQYNQEGDYLNEYEDDTVEKPGINEYYSGEYVDQEEYLQQYEDDTAEKPGRNAYYADEYVEQDEYLNKYEDDTAEHPGNEYFGGEYVQQEDYLNQYGDGGDGPLEYVDQDEYLYQYEDDTAEKPAGEGPKYFDQYADPQYDPYVAADANDDDNDNAPEYGQYNDPQFYADPQQQYRQQYEYDNDANVEDEYVELVEEYDEPEGDTVGDDRYNVEEYGDEGVPEPVLLKDLYPEYDSVERVEEAEAFAAQIDLEEHAAYAYQADGDGVPNKIPRPVAFEDMYPDYNGENEKEFVEFEDVGIDMYGEPEPRDMCPNAYGYAGPDNSQCFNDIDALVEQKEPWGFALKVREGQELSGDLVSQAIGCDVSKGAKIGAFTVTKIGCDVSLKVSMLAGSFVKAMNIHLGPNPFAMVGEEASVSPDTFSYHYKRLTPNDEGKIHLVFHDECDCGHILIHAATCGDKESAVAKEHGISLIEGVEGINEVAVDTHGRQKNAFTSGKELKAALIWMLAGVAFVYLMTILHKELGRWCGVLAKNGGVSEFSPLLAKQEDAEPVKSYYSV